MRFVSFSAVFLALILATQAHAQERQWGLDTVNNQAFLVFGVPESDDVGLSFWCDVGKSKVSVFLPETVAPLRRGEHTNIVMAIDGQAERFSATVSRDDGSGKLTIEATFGLKGSTMMALRAGQSLAITVKGHVNSFPITDADFDGLVDACDGIDPAG
ncbi:MAG: hypothetical protein ABJA10_08960 [Aestuariivirga sp.]